MRAKLLQQLSPEHQLLVFFSSYMRDLFNVIKSLKDTAYQLIGIQSPTPKSYFISSDIHSVLLACNTGYEDLRRVQTLLKGHVKGKMVSEAIAESVRQSRKIPYNHQSSRLLKEQSKKDSPARSKRYQGKHYSSKIDGKIQDEAELRLDSQSRKKETIDGQYYEINQNPHLRKIATSKSQGQLFSRNYQTANSQHRNNEKSSLNLIEKIRSQLQVAFNPK